MQGRKYDRDMQDEGMRDENPLEILSDRQTYMNDKGDYFLDEGIIFSQFKMLKDSGKDEFSNAGNKAIKAVLSNISGFPLNPNKILQYKQKTAALAAEVFWQPNFQGCDLQGVNMLLKIEGSRDDETEIESFNFDDSNLEETSFKEVLVRSGSFQRSKLKGATFLGGFLIGDVKLQGADMRETDLRGVEIHSDVDFTRAIMIGADTRDVKVFDETIDEYREATEREKQELFKNTIGKPEEFLEYIHYTFLSKKDHEISQGEFSNLHVTYNAANDIGKNGAKNRSDGTEICQPHRELAEATKQLKERFPTFCKYTPEQILSRNDLEQAPARPRQIARQRPIKVLSHCEQLILEDIQHERANEAYEPEFRR